jgi:ABC-type uncharacterized transport system fused permease/ATPase subunit
LSRRGSHPLGNNNQFHGLSPNSKVLGFPWRDLVLGSGLFVGLITFGVMMQITDAFTRVNNTVSQFIQNWQIITEVRSINRRLGEFEQQLGAPKQEKDAAEKGLEKAADDFM